MTWGGRGGGGVSEVGRERGERRGWGVVRLGVRGEEEGRERRGGLGWGGME